MVVMLVWKFGARGMNNVNNVGLRSRTSRINTVLACFHGYIGMRLDIVW